MKLAGLLLAGGRSSRMGGNDKAFVLLDNKPLAEHALACLEQRTEAVLINSNGPAERFVRYGHPVLGDCVPGHLGPLAGLLTGMLWARRHHPDVTHLVSAPCDAPRLPHDLATRLITGFSVGKARIVIARDRSGTHPTIGLWPVALADRLGTDLLDHGIRAMKAWLSQFEVAEVELDGSQLRNINTPADLRAADLRAAGQGAAST